MILFGVRSLQRNRTCCALSSEAVREPHESCQRILMFADRLETLNMSSPCRIVIISFDNVVLNVLFPVRVILLVCRKSIY